MRDFRDAKTMAHALRGALQLKAVEITHSEGLELIAKAFGFESWNILAAKIEAAMPHVPTPPAPAAPPAKTTLYCSFCGKSQHEVRVLIAGPTVFICDECTGLCNDVIEDKDILALLSADEEGGDRGYATAFAQVRAKSTEEVAALLDRSKRGVERHRIELHYIQRILATRDEKGQATDDALVPPRFDHLKGINLVVRQQHVARDLKRYEEALRIATTVFGER
jgi:hypothetical protein